MLVLVETLAAPELLARQLFRSGGGHIGLGRAAAAAVHPGDFQAGVDAKRFHRLVKDIRRSSSVNEGAKEHIATDSGEAFKVCDAHRNPNSHPRFWRISRQTRGDFALRYNRIFSEQLTAGQRPATISSEGRNLVPGTTEAAQPACPRV